MEDHLRTDLVLSALDMATSTRKPRGVVHHSDQGWCVSKALMASCQAISFSRVKTSHSVLPPLNTLTELLTVLSPVISV